MANSDPLVRWARRARRLPGYRRARRQLLRRLRSSRSVREVVKRVFAVQPAARPSSPEIAAGNLLGGLGIEQLPVVLVMVIDVPAVSLEAVVDEVAQLQVLGAAFRPLFVLDVPRFAPAQRFGYPVELVVARPDWSDETMTWETYLGRRLGRIMARYDSAATVAVGPDGLTDIHRALLAGPG